MFKRGPQIGREIEGWLFGKDVGDRQSNSLMAAREQGEWAIAELAAAVNEIPSLKESENLDKAIELLKRHDVIAAGNGGIRIASELMRRWIQAKDNSKFLINH